MIEMEVELTAEVEKLNLEKIKYLNDWKKKTMYLPLHKNIENPVFLTHIMFDEGFKTIFSRLRRLPRLIIQPYLLTNKLRIEYKDWKERKILDTFLKRFLYIVDHFFLWPLRSIYVCIKGGESYGFSW